MKYNNLKKYGILRQSVMISIIFCSIFFSINAASAGDKTYYWNPSSGVIDSSGFTANWTTCGAQPTSYRITILSNVGFTCSSDRLTTTTAGDQFLAIFPVAYSFDTNITGKTGATFYLSSQKTGYTATYRFDLGYAQGGTQGGTFTSLGYATKAVSSRNGQIYTVDLNNISGVAPAGSYLGLKVSITTSLGGRIYLGTDGGTTGSNSGRFYVNETVITTPPSTYNVTVKAVPYSATIAQGGNITYNITINNTGNTGGDYNLEIADSDSVNFASILGRTPIFVPAGGSNTTTLTVTANSSAGGGISDITTITATSVQNPSFKNSTQVQTSTPPPPRYNVTVRASPSSAIVPQGGNIIYNITVNNTGDTDGDYNLSISDSNSVDFSSVLEGSPVFVPAGGSNTTTLNVTANSSAGQGVIDITTVTVTSVQNPSFTNSTQVQTSTPPPPRYNVTVITLPKSATIPQGGNIIYNITVNNTGDTDGDYNLSTTDSDSVNFTPSVLDTTSIFVPAGGSNTTTLNVTANSSAEPGAIDITTVNATSIQNPSFTNSTQVQTSTPPLPTYDVTISAIPIFANIIPGNSFIYIIFVNNTGNTNGNYSLSVADSDLGNFTNSTLGVSTMQINSGSGAMTTLNVTAIVGATTGAIDNTAVTVVSENPAYTNSTIVQTTVTAPIQGPSCLDCHAGAE